MRGIIVMLAATLPHNTAHEHTIEKARQALVAVSGFCITALSPPPQIYSPPGLYVWPRPSCKPYWLLRCCISTWNPIWKQREKHLVCSNAYPLSVARVPMQHPHRYFPNGLWHGLPLICWQMAQDARDR